MRAPEMRLSKNEVLNDFSKALDRAPLGNINFDPRSRYRSTLSMAKNEQQSDTELSELLLDIIKQRQLHAVFQPIISMRGGEVIGYEGLIRGPIGSPLHMPGWIFEVANRHNLGFTVEMLSRQIVAEAFMEKALPGKLFLNISPDVLTQSDQNNNLNDYLTKISLPSERVIIELTENQPTYDLDVMREAILYYRGLGFEVAIDDLGDGFSSLRLWSELRPEFVKVDKHFIQGVSKDSLKLEFVKAIQQIALCCNSRVIAEGIENRQDFRIVRDLGIAFGQGYFIAHPDAQPAREPEAEARQALQSYGIAVYPGLDTLSNRTIKARKLLVEVTPVKPETENDTVFEIFNNRPDLISLPVVKDNTPVGLIHRHNLIDRFARPYRRELYGRKPCAMFMENSTLTVEHDLSIQDLSVLVADGDPRHLANGFIITEDGKYLGIGNTRDLIREITQLQINAARYANPLTLLPGNVPISEHTERLLNTGISFCACYCDVDNFKPFNDVYGYHKGDEIIRLTANVLSQQCDPERDFIGHIGGDDFIILFQSIDWEQRCRAALEQFALHIPTLVTDEDRANGGITTEDRRGQQIFYPIPTISLGVVIVHASELTTHLEVSAAAAEAKKQAKRILGNSLFIERRTLHSASNSLM